MTYVNALVGAHRQIGFDNILAGVADAPRKLITGWQNWRADAALRTDLSKMTDAQLADLGLVRGDLDDLGTAMRNVG